MALAASSIRLFLKRPIIRAHAQPPRPLRPAKRLNSSSTDASQPPKKPASGDAPATQSKEAITSPKPIPGPLWVWLEPIKVPFKAYGRVQIRRPYVTQFFSTLVIYFLGDLSAQSINAPDEDGKKPPHDFARTARALIIGGIASVPGYKWFMWLGNSFNYSSRFLSLLTKVGVNQLVFTPIFNTYFFAMQALMSGANLRETWERVNLAVPVSWWNSMKLWPAVTAFSFTFVAAPYRNIFAGVIAIGWQTYLSILNQRAARVEAAQRAAEQLQSEITHSPVAA